MSSLCCVDAVGTTGQVGKVGVGGEVGQGPGTVRTQEGERGKGVEENVMGLGWYTGANMVAEPGSATHGKVATVGGHKGEEKAAEVWGEIDSLKDQQQTAGRRRGAHGDDEEDDEQGGRAHQRGS